MRARSAGATCFPRPRTRLRAIPSTTRSPSSSQRHQRQHKLAAAAAATTATTSTRSSLLSFLPPFSLLHVLPLSVNHARSNTHKLKFARTFATFPRCCVALCRARRPLHPTASLACKRLIWTAATSCARVCVFRLTRPAAWRMAMSALLAPAAAAAYGDLCEARSRWRPAVV